MNKDNLKLFLYWIRERHNIFIKKEILKTDPPWTEDSILQEYKFTNPFRQNDRVTRHLTDHLDQCDSIEDYFDTIIIFRMFNHPETFCTLLYKYLVYDWHCKSALKLLTKYAKDGNQVFTGAYIITNNGKKESKIKLVCEAIDKLIKDQENIINAIKTHNTLENAVKVLSLYDMVGPFIAYELVTDMRHTPILNKARDIYSWANPGPGARRGIHRLLWNTERGEKPKSEPPLSMEQYQEYMRQLMVIAQSKLGGLKNFKGVKFEMRDIEHSLCEFDKYMRVLNGEGRPRSKYKYRR